VDLTGQPTCLRRYGTCYREESCEEVFHFLENVKVSYPRKEASLFSKLKLKVLFTFIHSTIWG
jgi:hypothetical protein